MKYSECNVRQKKAFKNILHASNWLLGGLENTMLDYPEDSAEYKSAKETLSDHDELVRQLYDMAITDVYDDGAVWFGANAQSFLKDVRFCGKDWLMERCEKRITKAGY